jgi:Tfp pilus assembly protein PilF
MKKFISAVVFSLTTFASAQNLDLIRKNYQKAVEDKKVCKEMIFQFEKLNSFNKAKKNIEKALQQEPDHLETIFIRYSVQKKSPAFLGYKNNLKDDKNLLSRNIDNISNPFLKDMIIQILKS